MRRHVELHIDKLVLRGLSPQAREAIGPAVEAELRRLIAAHGLPHALAEAGRVLHLAGGTHVAAAATRGRAAGIGTQLGGALHRQLAPEAPATPPGRPAAPANTAATASPIPPRR